MSTKHFYSDPLVYYEEIEEEEVEEEIIQSTNE